MNTRTVSQLTRPVALVMLAALALGGCQIQSPAYQGQRTFPSADAAARALADAANEHDVESLNAIFGPEGRAVLSSGDPVADQHGREVFAVAMQETWSLEPIDANTIEIIVGHEQWPFPIPIEKDANGWWFDVEEGRTEVLARRIGRNELAVIGALRTYAIAQREYASKGRDGKPPGIYARQIRSDPGMHNGLYWPVHSPSDEASPLGELAAQAETAGYSEDEPEGAVPFHGYHFRILTAQGAAAPGGAKSYLTGAEMTGGFAMLAFPATYLNSGVMSFLVGPDGIVHEADLGERTAEIAAQITTFDPDERWRAVE